MLEPNVTCARRAQSRHHLVDRDRWRENQRKVGELFVPVEHETDRYIVGDVPSNLAPSRYQAGSLGWIEEDPGPGDERVAEMAVELR